ncbi:DUF418 domain-containing protein [Nocardiopsis sp. L17-MgMaSL7]|uniref:DUF418 domain-containing protein n=1 Tax=Nocardiopsis sp. L17-MgMaSL7 TaxID=1938893 RepID=UPI000D71AF21|nr:DUF418 domain-containing protein [Nocardiopsis sp. L17-MgMaSL7]PWV51048.1 uncharacterized protein BDW27_107114 [Nocardiopsis sp. L17-MgMaSL7]
MTGDDTALQRAEPTGRSASGRLPLLDVLRGVAILGTLATNVWLFAGPGGDAVILYGTDELSPFTPFHADPSAATLAEGVFRTVANGKFLALLTLLFGAGLAIQFQSAARRGARWPGPYRWRALFLFVEGTVHFTLVFAGDVLMGYAAVALLAAWLLTRSERARNGVMWVSVSLHVVLMGLVTAALVAGPTRPTSVPPEAVELYAHGSYPEQVAFRLDNFLGLRLEPVLTFGLMVFMFLLGVRLLRAGAFADDPVGRGTRARLLGWGLGLGVPLTVLTALGGPDWLLMDRYVVAPLVAVGLIGLVGRLLDGTTGTGPVVAGVSALGRMAMTGYVTQNVILMFVCYGFGLGLADRMADTGRWWVLVLWAVVSLVLVVASLLWLRHFRQGPLEALQKKVLARAR